MSGARVVRGAVVFSIVAQRMFRRPESYPACVNVKQPAERVARLRKARVQAPDRPMRARHRKAAHRLRSVVDRAVADAAASGAPIARAHRTSDREVTVRKK